MQPDLFDRWFVCRCGERFYMAPGESHLHVDAAPLCLPCAKVESRKPRKRRAA
jgi:hypothetical protein